MKTVYIFILSLLSICIMRPAGAQHQGEILVKQKGLVFAYYHEGRQISKEELHKVLDSHTEATKELRMGYKNKLPAILLRVAGGLLLGYQVGTHISGGQSNWGMAGAGASMITLSIPFSGAAMKREQVAVQRYNTGLQQASVQREKKDSNTILQVAVLEPVL